MALLAPDRRLSWRKLLHAGHAWLGIITGLGMLLLAISGSLIVFRPELDRWLNPELTKVKPGSQRVSLDGLVEVARLSAPEGFSLFNLRVAPEPDVAAIAFMRRVEGNRLERMEIFLNPWTGELTGKRGNRTALMSWLYELHISFLAGTIGYVLAGLLGATLVLSCITGMLVHRRFLADLIRPARWRMGWRLLLSDWHRLIGVTSLVFNVIIGLTGCWFNAPKVRELWNKTAPMGGMTVNSTASGKTLEELLRQTEVLIPGFEFRSLQLPSRPGNVVRVRGGLKGHALWGNYSSEATYDLQTGELLRITNMAKAPFGKRLEAMFHPLHYGNFAGWPLKSIWCVLGLTPGFLAVSGAAMTWRRYRNRR